MKLTTDKSLLSKIGNHPRVQRWICDDFTDAFIFKEGWLYFEKEEKGFVAVQPINAVCYQLHVALIPELWGRGKQFCRECGLWLFAYTPCQKLVVIVPEINRLAIKICRDNGMQQEGILTKSFSKGFRLVDQLIFGISKR